VVTGPNNLPDPILNTPAVQAPVRRPAVDAAQKQPLQGPGPGLVQAPDSLQLSPQAQTASRVAAVVLTTPEVVPSRVEQATAKILSQTSNSGEVNAKLAEKLLTEN
jgi:hypothetical protein